MQLQLPPQLAAQPAAAEGSRPLQLHFVDPDLQSVHLARRDLPVLEVLADVREVEAGGDVPVDVADVVAGDVLADVREIETLTAKQRPVIALQQTVQAPDDRPVEPAERSLRVASGREHDPASARSVPGSAP